MKTKGGTRVRDFVPVRRVELVIACEDFPEEVLVVVFVIVLIAFIIEGGVTGQPGEAERRGIIQTSSIPALPRNLSSGERYTDLQDVHDDPCGPAVHGPAVPLPAHHLRSCNERNNLVISAAAGCSTTEKPAGCSLTQVLGRPTGVLDEPVLQFSKMEVADDYFGVLQTVVINQVLQLKEHMGVVTLGAFLLQGFHFQS